MPNGKLLSKLDKWARHRIRIRLLSKQLDELRCEFPEPEPSGAPGFLPDNYGACWTHSWPNTRLTNVIPEFVTCSTDLDGPPMSAEEAKDDDMVAEHWCDTCKRGLDIVIERKRLKRSTGGLTSALLREWEAAHGD
jgi:hypothetical protein